MSGTPLGLELYESSCRLIENETMEVKEQYRIMERCYEKLKSVSLFL